MATCIMMCIALLFGLLSDVCVSYRVDNSVAQSMEAVTTEAGRQKIQVNNSHPEDQAERTKPEDPEKDEEDETWDPLERRFGAGVSAISAQWTEGRVNMALYPGDAEPEGAGRFKGPSVQVTFPIGRYKDLKTPGEGECLRKCKVKTETSGVFGASCNGGLNWKKLQPWRKEKHAVSVAGHRPKAGNQEMPWVDRYTLCCEVFECGPESWKINYEFYSPMPPYEDRMDRFRTLCLCCKEALEKDNVGFHALSKVAPSCGVAFSLRSALGDVNGLGGYIPDSPVTMRVADSVWEPRCEKFCEAEADKPYTFGYPLSKLAIASWK